MHNVNDLFCVHADIAILSAEYTRSPTHTGIWDQEATVMPHNLPEYVFNPACRYYYIYRYTIHIILI